MNKIKKSISKKAIPVILCLITIILCSCTQQNDPSYVNDSDNLLGAVQKSDTSPSYDFTNDVEQPEGYDKFIKKNIDFSFDLLKNTIKENENSVVSPVSVTLALGMLENGSGGDTQKEIKKLIGTSVLSLDNINESCAYITQRLTAFNNENNTLDLANSLWASDKLSVKRGFLQKNENYFSIPSYSTDFSDSLTADKINNLTKSITHDNISDVEALYKSDTALYMVSTASVKGKWVSAASGKNIEKVDFTTSNGDKKSINFFKSTERYIKSSGATGFVKNLDNIPCRFVALLPDESTTTDELLENIKTENFSDIINNASPTDFAEVIVPEFEISYQQGLKSTLEQLGVKSLFGSDANLEKIAGKGIYLSEISQKAVISVNGQGICVDNDEKTENTEENATAAEKKVVFNRPFIFAVVDNESNLPILTGYVNDPVRP